MRGRFPLLLAAIAVAGGVLAGQARAAVAPEVDAAYVTQVSATSAGLRGEIKANGAPTSYRFEYLTEAAYVANLAAVPPREGFAGALSKPAPPVGIGSGFGDVPVFQQVSGLTPTTNYRYRLVATNSAGSASSPGRRFGTEEATNVAPVFDNRALELVSPVDKAGGSVQGFGATFGGGALQAAADGNSITYSSSSSFAGGAGSPGASQYISRRSPGGWGTENITTPAISGSYGDHPDGVPYRIFSTDLGVGLLLNGERCRGEGSGCPVANPPLPGSGAPAGYQDYYLRNDASKAFDSLLSGAELAHTQLSSSQFELTLAGATPTLAHVVLSSCAALSANAVEVPAAGGCDPEAQNLYEWSGGGLALLNLLPGDSSGTPSASLAAQNGAISADGARVYWQSADGGLYLTEAGQGRAVDGSGEAEFQIASSDGSLAYFLKAGHLYRYSAESAGATDLTPDGEVQGVLGASEDGARVYYQSAVGLFVWAGGASTEVAPGAAAAAASDYPPATGTARVSADGSHLLFDSSAELDGFENNGAGEVFLYGPLPGAVVPTLTCVSCNPTGERPQGSASIPGAIANGKGEGATQAYKPRVLSANGHRVFFDSSDVLVAQDTNNRPDVYEWEASGFGGCVRAGGCLQLISSGRSGEASTFVDASVDGSDAFFLTGESLVPNDPGSIDLYDAREGGGIPLVGPPIGCDGDACQTLPEAPEDPTPGTLVPNPGNPPVTFPKSKPAKHRHKKKHHHRKRRHRHSGQQRGGGAR